jgi:hypothetical protein
LACADAKLEVPEDDEDNNCRASESQVTVAKPDLHQLSTTAGVPFASPGAKITISDAVQNISDVTAPATTTRMYLSLDQVTNGGEVLLSGKRAIPEVPSGATNTGNATLIVPASVAHGSYYIVTCADDLLKLNESTETNNCAGSANPVLIGSADLVVTNVTDPPASAVRGTRFTVTDTTLNQGTIPAGETSTRYYVSLDLNKSGDDVVLSGNRKVPALADGDSHSGPRRVTVPLSTPIGTYYLIACSDDPNRVSESNDGNNCRAAATTIVINTP